MSERRPTGRPPKSFGPTPRRVRGRHVLGSFGITVPEPFGPSSSRPRSAAPVPPRQARGERGSGPADEAPAPAQRVRLQRFLAMAGLATRRQAEELISAGQVKVNGKRAKLGDSVDPVSDRVVVSGQRVKGAAEPIYLAINKPRRVLCTRDDPEGRATVMDLLPEAAGLALPVGRLDYHTSGLLLLTNDGELAYALMRPASEVPKGYRFKTSAPMTEKDLERIRQGVVLDGRRTKPARIWPVTDRPGCWYEMVLTEGRNRQVRRMVELVGNRVQKLTRTAIGPIGLGSLESGQVRRLNATEVRRLKEAAGLLPKTQGRRKPGWAVPKERKGRGGKTNRSAPGTSREPGTDGAARRPRRKGAR